MATIFNANTTEGLVITPDTSGEMVFQSNGTQVLKVTGATGSFDVPVGTTAERPTSPTTGTIRYNTTEGALETYDGSAWTSVGASTWTTTGSNIYYNTGNVGIGTSSPASLLHIDQGTGGEGLRFERDTYDTMDIELSESGLRFRNETDGRTDLFINGSGNVGIKTISPLTGLHVLDSFNAVTTSNYPAILADGSYGGGIGFEDGNMSGIYVQSAGTRMNFYTGQNVSTDTPESKVGMTLNGTNLQFNSGYGSVGTAYACRAWVNFRGTSTVTIRRSGGVSSVSDLGVGRYRVNFNFTMPDNDYAITGVAQLDLTNIRQRTVNEDITDHATTSCRIVTMYADTALQDCNIVNFMAFR